jgi:hypothetical protein
MRDVLQLRFQRDIQTSEVVEVKNTDIDKCLRHHDEAPWITSSPFSPLRASLHSLDCRALRREADLLIEHLSPAVATASAAIRDLLLILTHTHTNPHSIRDLSRGRRDLRSEALNPTWRTLPCQMRTK